MRLFSQSVQLVSFLGFASTARGQNVTAPPPSRFGYVLFPGFQALDVFGPLDALNLLSLTTTLNLTLIAATLEPVHTDQMPWLVNAANATFGEAIVPTHTFETAPADLDVLIVPGGLGTRAPGTLLDAPIEFVRARYPTVRYLISVCTGAVIAARAGVLDGRCATTNKKAWAQTTAWGPEVKWVPEARWVQDGNIWSSSGVSAGIDTILAFIAAVYGEAEAVTVTNAMEYRRETNPKDDPFAALYGLTDANNSTNQEIEKC
ncbi:hypothetical protein QTJ16_002346 [Diplocarpon rosae]|uniref:DJ-1/PfpI domain-containing protein n=1 Tax=Diplocarpon rosae TaxID=946125 RepID=A0AAD9T1M5_9HELO|nr:hypothetical protein QTJ16_002346 [Diplocarpon rosae]PBP25588.1 class I glutamine amidotransferase-like protein [Diplocarpon rosae]